MISATEWTLVCDHDGCHRTEGHTNRFRLWDEAEAEGWQLRVRKDGARAKTGGKDYCPDHRVGAQ